MYFPKYWKRGKGKAERAGGDSIEVEAWGWSDVSDSDATNQGAARAQRLAEALGRGERNKGYLYGSNPLREPVLEQVGSLGVVTRNGYGCEVLNTASVLFCDIDLPVVAPHQKLTGLLSGLFGSKSASAAGTPEQQAMAKVRQWVESNHAWGIEAYRTKAGLRLIATHALFDPMAGASEAFFDAVGADPYFRKLCQIQKSFRARLTPKPWRCGMRQKPPKWPFLDLRAQSSFENWLQSYQAAIGGYAVCARIEHLGSTRAHPDVQVAIKLHDGRTKADSGLPLA